MQHRWLFASGALAFILAFGTAARAGQPGAPGAAAGQGVLTAEHFWRKHRTYIPPRLSERAAKTAGLATDPAARAEALAKYSHNTPPTPPPPAGWNQPVFDDSGWAHVRGRQFSSASGGYSQMKYRPHNATDAQTRSTDPFVPEVGLICMRGYFSVTNKSKVKSLTLSLKYRGGFVAYLNGKEIARGHLPDGAVTAETPGQEYPLQAYFLTGQGKRRVPLHWWNHRESKQWTLRERSAGPVTIDPKCVKDGLNVLAVELHRSEWPAEVMGSGRSPWMPRLLWSAVGLGELTLAVGAEPGAVESLHPRRSGVQVWNADIARPVGRAECTNWDSTLQPIHITATRNGRFSGQVVVTGDRDLDGLTASVSPLKSADGRTTIPRTSIRIQYGAVNPTQMGVGLDYFSAVVPPDANFGTRYDDPASAMHGRFDLLLDSPPPGVASVPLWVTISVPKGARAGRYAGELTVRPGSAKPVTVPIRVNVVDLTLPDVADRVSLLNIYQSPDTLATYYKVKPWSDEHWRLIERSLKLMGKGGNIALIIPLLAESQMGNVESLIPWKRKAGTKAPVPRTDTAPAGSKSPVGDPTTPIIAGRFDHDFTAFDRYLKTALKHHPRLRYLFTIAYAIEMGGPFGRPVSGGYVTVVEPDGKRVRMQLPPCGTPECEALWKPLLKGIREHAEAAGFKGRYLLGMPCDYNPPREHLLMFRRAAPEYGWMHESHMRIATFRYGGRDEVIPVAYQSMVYTGPIPDPRSKRLYGWQRAAGGIVVGFNRPGFQPLALTDFPSPGAYRHWIEINLVSDRAGAGRVGGDYWHINARYKGGTLTSWASGGMRGTLFGSYAHSQVGQVGLANNTTDLFGPGPDGPVTTIRFENALAGIQEAEARIVIEKALLDAEHPLPADLAARCQATLDARVQALRGLPGDMSAERLFSLAGEVAKARAALSRPAPKSKEK